MGKEEEAIEKKVIDTFAGVASSLGYSDLHGKILAALLIAQEPISLRELAHKTNYSLSTISLSIDLLEVLGVIKKIKKGSDRKVYVLLNADLLDCLKKAVIAKLDTSINTSLSDLQQEKQKTKNKKLLRTISILEREIRRLHAFMDSVSKIDLPAKNNSH